MPQFNMDIHVEVSAERRGSTDEFPLPQGWDIFHVVGEGDSVTCIYEREFIAEGDDSTEAKAKAISDVGTIEVPGWEIKTLGEPWVARGMTYQMDASPAPGM